MNWQEVLNLIESEAQEGAQLEFKRGAALSLQNAQRGELVKDVTGFANAGGGRIIYGIGEKKNAAGKNVAGDISPVEEPKCTAQWITQILTSLSMPPLHDFTIAEIEVPDKPGCRVVVVDVEASSTAHQNLNDKVYYSRFGETTIAMQDFQIRDVMARRTKPMIEVNLGIARQSMSSDQHTYQVLPVIKNVGQVSIEKWCLEIEVPKDPFLAAIPGVAAVTSLIRLSYRLAPENYPLICLGYTDPSIEGKSLLLHPGQDLTLNKSLNLPEITLKINSIFYEQLSARSLPIRWRMFLMNAAPLEGQIAFEKWCQF